MGNRATIGVVENNKTAAPAYIYLHWHGSPEQVVKIVRDAAPRMRAGDASYATARLVGEFHNLIDGGLSLGICPADDAYRDDWDNGHYVVDMGAGTVERIFATGDDTTSSKVEAEGLTFGNF